MTRDAVVRDLSWQIRRLTLTTQQLRVQVAGRMGIGVTELVALGHLSEAGPLTAKALAELLQLSTGTVTAVTDHLVDAGLARRTPNPVDRRSILLRATPEGARARKAAERDFERLVGNAVTDLPPTLLTDVTCALDAVSARIDAAALPTAATG